MSRARSVGVHRHFAPWVRALRRKSGVYVIRSAVDRRPLYVGESHTGKLYETLTRHFQEWDGETAGRTYDRLRVLVTVYVLRRTKAVAFQDRLICKLDPEDNRTACNAKASADLEEAPF